MRVRVDSATALGCGVAAVFASAAEAYELFSSKATVDRMWGLSGQNYPGNPYKQTPREESSMSIGKESILRRVIRSDSTQDIELRSKDLRRILISQRRG